MATEFMATIPHDFKLPSPESEYDINLLKEIEQIKWKNVHVSAEGNLPAFAYTIGHFYMSNHPEIIVIGLKSETAHQLLNIAAVKIAGAKERIQPYKKYTDLTEGLSLMFIPVSVEHYGEYLGYGNWFYGSLSNPYPALQMVWPDKKGLFPWDKGFDKQFIQIQPIIGKTPN
jgi:hypothetical protein